jgi:carboxymethylenebutenolidase
MKTFRHLPFLVLLLPFSAFAAGAEGAQEVVNYPSGPDKVSGFVATPPTAGKHPGLVVIHEWWGQNEWVKSKAKSFAAKGYVALAVDLYRGQVASDPDTAHQLMRGMPEDRAKRDLRAAFDYLASRPDVDAAHIGAIGWCMGGGEALDLALMEPRLAAAVLYYGHLATDGANIAKIKAPLLGNFGADDKGISPESVNAFQTAAKNAGVSADFKVYPGAGHGFASSADSKVFKPEAAKDADARTDAFLKSHLQR